MSKKDDLFSHPRWHDPPKGETIGKVEFTEEEKRENKRKIDKVMEKVKRQQDDG
ncbi:hypothetical protein [Pseudogracilibacillus sp. SO30301A]|uniref:hypothetical protein n=1 Tax=Pseudogracilibacillus sp. SO30301A TaxID=3098291 RepID=UPI00300DF722